MIGRQMSTPSRSDMQLMKRAMVQRWPVSDAVKTDVVEKLQAILKDGGASERDRIRAAEVLMAAEKQNQQDEIGPKKELHGHIHINGPGTGVAAIAERFGIKFLSAGPVQEVAD